MREVSQARPCPIPEVLEDNRWGWTEYYIGIRGETLLISPAVQKCVVFLGRRHNGVERIVATAFFLSLKVDRFYFTHLVTAAHIIEHTKSSDYSDDGIIYLYLNSNSGTRFKTIRSEIKHWYMHPTDSAIDVAVLPFKLLSEFDHLVVGFEFPPEFEKNPQRWEIGVGTDVFLTGLFVRHRGRQRNIPIVRTGTIAALPDQNEPVDISESDNEERNVTAYLIETHSLGGLSGSPVFANPVNVNSEHMQDRLHAMHIWIGVVSAHWDFEQDQSEREKINSGIAIVSPKESVKQVLDHPRLIEMRDKTIRQETKRNAPTMDDGGEPLKQKTRAPKPEDRIDIPIPTRGQFERDLAKATRKRDK